MLTIRFLHICLLPEPKFFSNLYQIKKDKKCFLNAQQKL